MKDNNKDIANTLNKYTDYAHKGTNFVLDSADSLNKWYAEQLNKITESDIDTFRIETGVNDTLDESNKKEIFTKVKQYNEIQTNKRIDKSKIINKLQIVTEKDKPISENSEINGDVLEKNNSKLNTSKKISTSIKGIKLINNTSQKIIRTGKDISVGLDENGTTAFKTTSSRIMTKPIKKIASKVSNNVTKESIKYMKKFKRKKGTKVNKKIGEKVLKRGMLLTTNVMVKFMKLLVKLMADTVKLILSMLPQIAPVIIIIVIIAAIGYFFNLSDIEEVNNINFDEIEKLMIVIEDKNLQAIYNEFLKNIGKPYLMDHSNLNHTECMEYYDCSSWVIHCLSHTGIITIPNTDAEGIYDDYCTPIDVNERKGGDLIFLKDTYDTGNPGSISHIGIYMGILTINGETAEWVIDTGGNPSGIKIQPYNNGWWNGSNFYGFARLNL